MDSLSTQKVKPRKMKVVMKKSRNQKLLDLFYRLIEITIVLVTVAKLCYQLVITFEGFGLTGFLVNRHLAFILGNAIVITLVAKCGFFANQELNSGRNNNDFLDEFVRQSSRRDRSLQTDVICREKQSTEENRAKQRIEENRAKQSIEVNRAKQSIEVNRAKQSIEVNRAKQSIEVNRAKQSSEDKKQSKGKQIMFEKDITVKRTHKQIIVQKEESPMKSYERSQSENLEVSNKSSCAKLKRSESERSAERCYTDEELRYKIESFIARQRRNQKDEEFCFN